MAKKKSLQSNPATQPLLVLTTETEAGLEWLRSLPEDQFRDRILLEVFRRMQAEGAIQSFENIHGRNDKGVDYLVAHTSVFGSTIRGIQIKSKRITRSESSGALSAVRIREECQATMLYEFHFQGRNIRLEGIDLWCSAEMTEDAEKEMNPPLAPLRIGIKKDRELLSLVEKYCPTVLTKVPQFAIAKYISDSRNPGPKSVRILGCNLNPSIHFIEPFFSTQAPSSHHQLKQKHGTFQVDREKISMQHIIANNAHTVVFAPPLSGRTYLLEHLSCKIAESGKISLILKPADIPKGEFKLENIIAHRLGFASPKQVRELADSAGIVLLVDDIDRVPFETRQKLFAAEPKSIRILATARSLVLPTGIKSFHVSGVDWLSIVRFLRTVDHKLAAGKPFVDRARLFIDRAFSSSGLPKNPFTIAVMLEECQHSVGKFSTPTMGRLIGRFIELQLGSHTDATYVVDFETKREFLTRLAGHSEQSFKIQMFEKLLGRFIEAKGHPHSITDFSNDLLQSGVFHRVGDSVEWAHPVIKEFFWVKNLVAKKKLGPIQKRLAENYDTTLAALAGSQLENANILLDGLLPRLAKISLPSLSKLVDLPELTCSLASLISDKDEETLLADLESEAAFQPILANSAADEPSTDPTAAAAETLRLSPEQRAALKKRLEPIVNKLAESQFHIAFNVAALLINARDTSRAHKEQSVDAVITSCQLLAQFSKEITSIVFDKSKQIEFLSAWISVLTLCSMADGMLGDPHLVSIFRSRLKQTKDPTRKLVILDLLISCGEEENKRILAELNRANHLGITMAFYWRVAFLYFFRFHRDVDRSALRKLLSDIRKSERGFELPKLV
jgi:hypothetical protein